MTERTHQCAACAAAFETDEELRRHAQEVHARAAGTPSAGAAAEPT